MSGPSQQGVDRISHSVTYESIIVQAVDSDILPYHFADLHIARIALVRDCRLANDTETLGLASIGWYVTKEDLRQWFDLSSQPKQPSVRPTQWQLIRGQKQGTTVHWLPLTTRKS